MYILHINASCNSTAMKMASSIQKMCSILAMFMLFGLINGEMQEKFSQELKRLPTIYVNPSIPTAFHTIQSAIDYVPSNNNKWVCISIKAGVYNEQVTIPPDKPFIYLKGQGMGRTNVVWSSNDSIVSSAAFFSRANNVFVSDMTFTNSYNYPFKKNRNVRSPAVAAMISGDKTAFYRSSFLGLQDTLFDESGRHYFKFCTIVGAVDFIFGGGQSIYENSAILFTGESIEAGSEGYITAQGRASPHDTNGFVFKNCNVTGTGKAYLGRAWKSYARTIFHKSFFSDIIVPQGWDAWFNFGHENQLTFAENGCYGLGSNMRNRVKWEKTLSQQEIEAFTNLAYIDNERWIEQLPINVLA